MLTPNIDERGRRYRGIAGSVCVGAAIGVALTCRPWSTGCVIAVVSLAVGGLFMIFEARRGWCALRACGIKTPL